MARQYTDEELDALLGSPGQPKPEQQATTGKFDSAYLDQLLDGGQPTAQAPAEAAKPMSRGVGATWREGKPRGLMGPHVQLGMRAVTGAAAAAGEIGAGLATTILRSQTPGKTVAVPFDRREFVRKVEQTGLLSEANTLERAVQYTFEGAVDYGTMIAGGAALKAAGLAPALANAVALAGTMSASMQAQATAQGKNAPAAKDMGLALALAAGSYGLGLGASAAIIKGVSKLRPLSKAAQEIIGNATTGLMFEVPGATGIPGVLPRDPEWKARLLAAAPSMMIVNVHGATFPGEARARTKAGLTRQMEAAADLANEVQPHERYPTFTQTGVEGRRPAKGAKITHLREPVENQAGARYLSGQEIGGKLPARQPLTAADRAAIINAEDWVKNSHVGPDGKPGQIPTVEEIMSKGIPRPEAERIARIKPTAGERAEILETRRTDAALERVPPEIVAEVRYRAGMMEAEERALYESVRRDPPIDQVLEIERQVERVKRGLAEVIAEPIEGGMGGYKVSPKPASEIELSQRGEPGPVAKTAVSPELGEARPPAPMELAARGEPGPVAKAAVSPELGEAPQRTGEVELFNREPGAKAAPSVSRETSRVMADLENVFRETKATKPPGDAIAAPKAPPPKPTPLPQGAPKDAAATRVVEEASAATNAEVVATSQTPAEVAGRVRRSVEQARATLGEAAEKPLPAGTKKTKQTKKVAAAETEIDDALTAIQERAQRNEKLRPKGTGQGKFWESPGGQAVVAGAAAGTALAAQAISDDEDDTLAKVAIAAGFPAFAFLGGRRKNMNQASRWSDRIAIADAEARPRVREQVGKTSKMIGDKLIYTGGAGPRANEREIQEIANAAVRSMQESPPKVQHRGEPTFAEDLEAATASKAPPRKTTTQWIKNHDMVVGTAMGTMGRMGPAGKTAENMFQQMWHEIREDTGTFERAHTQIDTGPFKDNPATPLHGEKAQWLNAFMNWKHAPDMLPKPDMEKIRDPKWQDVQRRVAVVLKAYDNLDAKDVDVQRAVQADNDFSDTYYAGRSVKAAQLLDPFQTRMTVNGQYRPQMLDPEMFDPPEYLRGTPGYNEKLQKAHQLQEAAAATAVDGPIDIFEFRESLRHIQDQGYSEGRMLDVPLNEIGARKAGPLDFSRFKDLRVGIIWDPAAQRNRYQAATARRLASAQTWGGKAEIAQAIRAMVEKDGYDARLFTDLWDISHGGSRKLTAPGDPATIMRSIATVASLPLTAFSAIPQAVQFFTPALRVGIKNTVKAWPDAIRGSIEQSSLIPKSMKGSMAKKRAADFYASAGTGLSHPLISELQGMGGPVRRLADFHYRVNQTRSVDRGARNVGKSAGKGAFDQIMDEIKIARQRGRPKDLADRFKILDEIFREQPRLAEAAKQPTFEPGQYEFLERRAAMHIDDAINNDTMPGKMPRLYSHPVGRTFYTVASFAYASTRNSNFLVRDYLKRSPRQKAAMVSGLGFATVGGTMVYALRDALLNRDKLTPEDGEALDRFVIEYVINAAVSGFLGPAYLDAFHDLRGTYGNPAVQVLGPSWTQYVAGGNAAKQSMDQESKDPLLRWGIRAMLPRPVAKKVVQKVAPSQSQKKQLSD